MNALSIINRFFEIEFGQKFDQSELYLKLQECLEKINEEGMSVLNDFSFFHTFINDGIRSQKVNDRFYFGLIFVQILIFTILISIGVIFGLFNIIIISLLILIEFLLVWIISANKRQSIFLNKIRRWSVGFYSDIDLTNLGLDSTNLQTRRQIRKRKLQELSKMLYIFGVNEKSLKLTEQSNRSLVVMTEGPTHNILRWTCPIYNRNGAQHTMIGTGYHPEEAWNSIYFQIIHSLLVLVKHGILFKELSLEKNIFIKDIFHNASNIGHWKYNIDNHSFYVPNHGFVVMFDSSYSDDIDIMNKNNTLDRETISKFNKTRHYKINSQKLFELSNSKEFIEGSDFKTNEFNQEFKKSIINMLSNETLRRRIEEMRGIMPSKSIFDKLKNIFDKISSSDANQLEETLKEVLAENFSNYLHSRLGTPLSKNEMNNVSLLPIRNFKQGSLVIYQERYGEYNWAIYVGRADNGKHKIIKDDKVKTSEVFLSSLRSYPENMPISHSFKQGYKYEDDDLLDTYTI